MNDENKTGAVEEVVKPAPLKNLPDLKALREERGLTTEDIFLKTRINSAILNAIEHGDFHLLPAPVSTNKFIRIYAETIGIDAEIILAHYQRYVDEKQVPEAINVVKASAALERKPVTRYFRYALPAVAIIAAVCIVYVFVQKKEPQGIVQQNAAVTGQKEAVPAPVPPPSPVKDPLPEALPNVPPAAQPAVVVPKEPMQTPDNAKLNLLIDATEDTWLSVTEDRKAPFQITLKKGEKLSRTAREFFVIDVGNAAGVNITFLGKPLGSLGRKGQVVHLRLPPQ